MTEYLAPGVYIEEVPSNSHPIEGVPTSTAAFIDIFAQGPIGKAVKIDSYAAFERVFGGLHSRSEASYAIQQYYLNGGRVAWVVRVDDPCAEKLIGDPAAQTGMYALEGIAPEPFSGRETGPEGFCYHHSLCREILLRQTRISDH